MVELGEHFPYIDERVRTMGTSRFRNMTASALRKLKDEVIVVQDSKGNNLAVLCSYETFLRIQEQAHKVDQLISKLQQFPKDCDVMSEKY